MSIFHGHMFLYEQVLEDDHCAPGQDFVDILARDHEPVPVDVIEYMKEILHHACYEPGEFVGSDHTRER